MPPPSSSVTRPPPKQARSAAKRDAILAATEALLDDHSPANLSTRMIAEAAHVPVGSIYRYFTDADDLLRTLFARMNAGTIDLLRASLDTSPSNRDTPDWRMQVKRTFDHLTQMHLGHPAYGPLMAHLDRTDCTDDDIAELLRTLVKRGDPTLTNKTVQIMTRTVMAIMDGVERGLYRLPHSERVEAMNEAGIAVTAYLSHYLDAGS